MAIRTLNRETDPPEGHLPSPTPQAWNPAIQDYQDITGQDLGNGRFGADGVQWGKTSSGIYLPIRVTNEGVQEVQLSGTNVVEAKTIFERRVLSSNSGLLRANRPDGARGLNLSIIVHGVTGTFTESEGLSCTLRLHPPVGYTTFGRVFLPRTTVPGGYYVCVYPGCGAEEGWSSAEGSLVLSRSLFVPPGNVSVELNPTGTFEAGEGFDCEVMLEWLR